MGLYDYIKCEVPLPDGFQGTLQTKDLCCEMVTHTITKNGRLICERIDSTELLPKAERDYPDAPDGSLRSWIGSIRTHTSQYDANFHGILNFYGCEGKGAHDHNWRWHEYNAKFTDGNLVEIAVAKAEA